MEDNIPLKCAIPKSTPTGSTSVQPAIRDPLQERGANDHSKKCGGYKGERDVPPIYEAPQKKTGEAAEAQKEELQRLAMILTHATSLFGLLHPIASTISHGGSPE